MFMGRLKNIAVPHATKKWHGRGTIEKYEEKLKDEKFSITVIVALKSLSGFPNGL